MAPEREWRPLDPALMSKAGRKTYSPPLPLVPDYTPERIERELLRADLCAVATRRCYKHAAQVVDDILAEFNVSRKPLKEKKK